MAAIVSHTWADVYIYIYLYLYVKTKRNFGVKKVGRKLMKLLDVRGSQSSALLARSSIRLYLHVSQVRWLLPWPLIRTFSIPAKTFHFLSLFKYVEIFSLRISGSGLFRLSMPTKSAFARDFKVRGAVGDASCIRDLVLATPRTISRPC